MSSSCDSHVTEALGPGLGVSQTQAGNWLCPEEMCDLEQVA